MSEGNTGDWNTGDRNTGDWNTGDWNTGDWNTGYRNTGDRNTGDWNTGDCNTGDWNTGYFCENEGPVTFFDLPCSLTRDEAIDAIPYIEMPIGAEWVSSEEMSDQEKADNPDHVTIGGYLKARVLPINEAFPKVWPTLDVETRRKFVALPNFDAAKFERITGVDVLKDADLFPQSVTVPDVVTRKRIVIDGETFELVPVSA